MLLRGLFLSIAVLFCQFDLATAQANGPVLQAHNIRMVPRETLSDLAVAVADPIDPVIYYNPRLMARYGAELSAFVLAHEYAHIQLAHRRPTGPVPGSREALERLIQGWELEADCVAAARLAGERPSALRAAIDHFDGMGEDRVDGEHPTGIVRAARLAACGRTANGDLRVSSEGPRAGATAIQFR